jgi:regulatory protein YycI of two-component signal transduction system YycFG
VSENQMSITEGEQTKVVDAGKLSKGVYFYQLYKGPAIFQKGKIVKF